MSKHNRPASPVTVTKYKDGQPTSTVEMKDVSMPKTAEIADAAKAKEAKPAPAPKEPKIPAESKLVRDATYTFVKAADETVKHHQQQIILQVMDGGKVTTLKDIVAAISSDQSLVQKMDTRQPIERCVRYHSRWLADHGFITVVKAEKPAKVEKAKAEKPAKTEAPSKLAEAAA